MLFYLCQSVKYFFRFSSIFKTKVGNLEYNTLQYCILCMSGLQIVFLSYKKDVLRRHHLGRQNNLWSYTKTVDFTHPSCKMIYNKKIIVQISCLTAVGISLNKSKLLSANGRWPTVICSPVYSWYLSKTLWMMVWNCYYFALLSGLVESK